VKQQRDLEDADLVRSLIAGEGHAPRALWQRFAPTVFRILRRAFGPGQDAEDLAQEIFLCVFEKVSTLREPTALRKFIISITVNTARGEVRRRWVRRWGRVATMGDATEDAIIEVDTDSREALRRFYGVLDRLNPHDRTLFVLRFIEELPLMQLAEASGFSLATTKRRLARARSKVLLLVERDPVLCDYLASRASGLDSPDGVVTCYLP
jgi:RNA polymerase sigma-70 factor (ECF subfamily)